MTGPRPRVAITGIGVVSPYGVGRERYWSCVTRGCSATRAIDEFDVSDFPCRVAAPLPPIDIEQAPRLDRYPGSSNGDDRADPRRYSRASLAGVIAAREAWADAGLRLGEPRAGVIVGSGAGGIEVGERQYREFFTDGLKKVTPYAIPVSIVGMISSEISISLQLHGISHVLSTGCTSSTDAVGYAAALLRSGEYDVLLSGGVDACVTPGMMYGFSRMRVMTTRYNDAPQTASRPFDRGRDGFVLGEGAWMLTLEREETARARGARVYAWVEGYGSTCDAYHRVQMDPEGAEIVRAMRMAIERSGRAPESIGYVNYHGTSTQLNDAIEVACVKRVFGKHAEGLPGSSTKSMVGHPQGASGACGLATTALALQRGVLPPTINLVDPDPLCDLDFVPNVSRAARVEAALCNCLGFGSKNSAIVLSAPDA
ncbi:MAG TPA: beta-ketoacyl-[acyl-carrier-protein] synthase family protein [Vicinamibacterales bacterium]